MRRPAAIVPLPLLQQHPNRFGVEAQGEEANRRAAICFNSEFLVITSGGWGCTMDRKSGISRRSFMASAAVGAAVGLRFPWVPAAVAASRGRTNDEAKPEPLRL